MESKEKAQDRLDKNPYFWENRKSHKVLHQTLPPLGLQKEPNTLITTKNSMMFKLKMTIQQMKETYGYGLLQLDLLKQFINETIEDLQTFKDLL